MDCKKCLWPVIIILLILAFLAYLVLSVFIVPIKVECDYLNVIPQDTMVNLSLGEWIFGNMISGTILFSLLVSFSKNSKSNNECLIVLFLIITFLYCIFETIWAIIGFIIYFHYYQDACSQVESFDTLITSELVFGAILFPLIILSGLAVIIKIITEQRRAS